MARTGVAVIAVFAACGTPRSTSRDAGSGSEDEQIDAEVARKDSSIDASPPPPRTLALAAIGSRSSLRVYVPTATSFRKVLDMTDPLGFGTGVAWTDYDADGRDDLVSTFGDPQTVGANEMVIVHNDGDSGLSTAGHRTMNPSQLAGYDADSDGDGDVYVGMQGGSDLLFQSSGGQMSTYYTWSEPGNSSWEYGLDVGDMNGDGKPDIALARGLYGEAIATGTFGPPLPTWSQPASGTVESADAAVVDFDGDGQLDASFAKRNSGSTIGSLEIYRWNGTTFVPLWSTTDLGAIFSLSWADIDNDGDADLAACAGSGLLRVYQRAGTVFTPHSINAMNLQCFGVTWGDYDADGDPDLAVIAGSIEGGVTIYNNAGAVLTNVFEVATGTTAIAWGRCSPGITACFADAPTL